VVSTVDHEIYPRVHTPHAGGEPVPATGIYNSAAKSRPRPWGVKRIRAFPLGRTFGLPGLGPSDIRKANKSHAKPLSEAAAELSHRPSATFRTEAVQRHSSGFEDRPVNFLRMRNFDRTSDAAAPTACTAPPQKPCSGSWTKVPPQHTRVLPLLAPYPRFRHGFVTKSHIQSPYSEQRPRAILSHILIRSSIAEMFSESNTTHFAPCSERRQTSSSIFIKNSTTFLISPRVRGRSVADLGSSSSGSFSFNASVIS